MTLKSECGRDDSLAPRTREPGSKRAYDKEVKSNGEKEREGTQGMTLSTAMLFPFPRGPLRAASGKGRDER